MLILTIKKQEKKMINVCGPDWPKRNSKFDKVWGRNRICRPLPICNRKESHNKMRNNQKVPKKGEPLGKNLLAECNCAIRSHSEL